MSHLPHAPTLTRVVLTMGGGGHGDYQCFCQLPLTPHAKTEDFTLLYFPGPWSSETKEPPPPPTNLLPVKQLILRSIKADLGYVFLIISLEEKCQARSKHKSQGFGQDRCTK